MRQFLYCEAGYVEKNQWLPNSWVNVECPTPEDLQFLMDRFNVPESFLSDIADTDERPRTETEGNWLLTILRIPMQSNQHGIPFITVPIGIITNNDIIVSVCYHHTELIPVFVADALFQFLFGGGHIVIDLFQIFQEPYGGGVYDS